MSFCFFESSYMNIYKETMCTTYINKPESNNKNKILIRSISQSHNLPNLIRLIKIHRIPN